MGRALLENSKPAQALFERAKAVLGYDLADVCLNGPAEKLDSTVYSQPALYVVSLAALEEQRAKVPDMVDSCSAAAGLSLGEYSALVFAGVLDFESGLRVVQRRGQAMQAAADLTPSGMVSMLGLERDVVERVCADASLTDSVLRIANFLCPGNIVCSGHKSACERGAELAVQAGAMKAIPLTVAGAFHTEIMLSAQGPLREALANVTLSRPRIPVVSNVDAVPHDDPEEIRELLVRQVIAPVRWEESMRWLGKQGFSNFIEVGPGRVLRGLLNRIDRSASRDGVVC